MNNNHGTSLLTRCVFSIIRKRHLMILRQLERDDQISGEQLAVTAAASRRTIISDIEELRQIFEETIEIIATSHGYELMIKDLAGYQKKKQELLLNDPNLLFLHFLCQQTVNLPEILSEKTGLSNQTFNKQQRHIQQLLADYGLTLDRKKWRIMGSEANLRIFYAAFYFSEEEQPYTFFEQLPEELTIHAALSFPLDMEKAIKWIKVFLLRAKQGGQLKEDPSLTDFCQLFLSKIDFRVSLYNKALLFSEQELSILVFLMLDEEALLSFLMHNNWIEKEVPFALDILMKKVFPQQTTKELMEDQVMVTLTLAVLLLDKLFHVPIKATPEQTAIAVIPVDEEKVLPEELSRDGYQYLVHLGGIYLAEQASLKNQLLIVYQLQGPRKIQQWIQGALNDWLAQRGINVVLENKKDYSFLRVNQVIITDHQLLYMDPQIPIYFIDRSVTKEAIGRLGEQIHQDFQKAVRQNGKLPFVQTVQSNP